MSAITSPSEATRPAGPITPAHVGEPVGVLLLSFGSPRDDADIPAYLGRIRDGRPVPPELVTDLRARYRRIGCSPLEAVTRRQAGLLQMRLDPGGAGAVTVRAAMLHSDPSIPTAVEELLASGAGRLVALPVAPQLSPHHAMYRAAVEEAAGGRWPVHLAGSWHRHELLLTAIAERAAALLGSAASDGRTTVLFAAHSLPLAAAGVDAYRRQVEETAAAVAARLGLELSRWGVAFQSRSGPPDLWLGPDLLESVAGLARDGCRRLVVVPIQFVSDHLEVLHDLDVVAREAAEARGMLYLRPASLNASADLIAVLADVVAATLARDGVPWHRGPT